MIGRTLLLIALPASLAAQSAHASLDSLASTTAEATRRFADRRVASREGYRRLGADFPAMGEHWLNAGALLAGTIDAARPTLLVYADLGGRSTLLGVGFVVTTNGAAAPPDLPGGPGVWHEHSGLLGDESGVAPGARVAGRTRVWVLHIWTSLANPAGAHAPDNWSLPFARLGLTPPAGGHPDAARALSLASGGDAYLRDLLTDARLRTEHVASRVDSLVDAARARVLGHLAARAPHGTLSSSEAASLGAEWTALARALRSLLGAEVDRFLLPAHPRVVDASQEPERHLSPAHR